MVTLFRRILSQMKLTYETFSSQLLRGCTENQFFHFFGLLHDIIDLKGGENFRQCSSRFLENVFHQAGFIVQIHKTTWLWKFLVINNFRVLCLAFSFSSFENSKSYLSVTASSTSHSRKLERSYVEISSDALENLLNLQESIDCIIAMKSVSCTKIRISH